MLTPALGSVTLFRISHALHRRGHARPARAAAWLNQRLFRAVIDPACRIGPGFYLPHPNGVLMRGCAGRNLTLYSHAVIGPDRPAPMRGDTLAHCPRFGDDVTVAAGTTVLGPIRIGAGVRIGPNAVVDAPVGDGLTAVRRHRLKVTPRSPDGT